METKQIATVFVTFLVVSAVLIVAFGAVFSSVAIGITPALVVGGAVAGAVYLAGRRT